MPRPSVDLDVLILEYPKTPEQRASSLLHDITHVIVESPLGSDQWTKGFGFLLNIGSEVNPSEPDADRRLLARQLVLRNLAERLITRRTPTLVLQYLTFLRDHADKLSAREHGSLRRFFLDAVGFSGFAYVPQDQGWLPDVLPPDWSWALYIEQLAWALVMHHEEQVAYLGREDRALFEVIVPLLHRILKEEDQVSGWDGAARQARSVVAELYETRCGEHLPETARLIAVDPDVFLFCGHAFQKHSGSDNKPLRDFLQLCVMLRAA